jgi:hypothetical protein|nr:MAG TPA: hypothetical protein [Caudoviricetes sp.]
MNRLRFNYKEAGRLTIRQFSNYYQHYKDTFDLEMRLYNSNTTYADLKAKQLQAEEWF